MSNDTVVPCSSEELECHLRGFIRAFVPMDTQSRWTEFLIDKREQWDVTPRSAQNIKYLRKAEDVLRKFTWVEPYCSRLPNEQLTAAYLRNPFGTTHGVYFSLGTPPCKMTAYHASAKFAGDECSAVLSFEAGKKALFFCHDGGVWRCEKR